MELLQDYGSGSGSSTTSFQSQRSTSPGPNLPVPPTRQETMGWKPLEWYAIYGEQKRDERLDAYMPEGVAEGVKELNAVAEASAECLKTLNLAIDQAQDALALDRKETLARCTIELIEAVKKEKEARDRVESAERKRKECFDAMDMSIASHMMQRSIAINVLKTIDSLGIFAEEIQPMMLESVCRMLNERRFPNIRTVAFVPPRSKDEEKTDEEKRIAASRAQVQLENLANRLDLAFVVRSPGSPPSSPGLTLSSSSPLPSSSGLDDDFED